MKQIIKFIFVFQFCSIFGMYNNFSSGPAAAAARKIVSINAHMSGQVYLSPNVGAAEFVKIGDEIQVGQVVCIINAMKSMYSVKSDKSGIVKAVLVQSNQFVDSDQRLIDLIELE